MSANLFTGQQVANKKDEKRAEMLADFKKFWAEKDRAHPLTAILNLCFRPMEPREFCTIWVPKIWPYIETPASNTDRLPKYFHLASEVLLSKILSMDGPYVARWVRNPQLCTSNLAKLHLRAVHIIWTIHFYTGFPTAENTLPRFASVFYPASASAFHSAFKKHKM